ncbi:MAG: tetratricopeptide repeat protein [Acidobacteriaceae bacterium]
MRKTLASLSVLAVFSLLCCAPAHAVSKEMIQLQTQVQNLQDALNQLQRSQDAQLAVMQQVLKTVSDNVSHVNATVTTLQNQVQAQQEAGGGKIDQLSTQMQGINDSVDELRSRIDNLKAQLQAIQSQLQNINTQPAAQPTAAPGQPGQPGTDQTQQPVAPPPQPQAPPVKQLYQGAMSDYEGARYDLATSEFGDVLKYYPQDDLAGNAQFYLGEIAYRQGKYSAAISDYNTVLEQFPGSTKAPASELRKGEAELAVNQRELGIRDLRSLVARYPQSPEAAQARSRLNGMGVRVSPRPSAARQ